MQIGIDVGATKIESVILDDSGSELHRSRIKSPKNYIKVIQSIKERPEKYFHVKMKQIFWVNSFF